MRKAIELSSIAAFAKIGEASKSVKHPFVGDHANANSVHHENGSISMRLGAKTAGYNKYDSFINSDDHFAEEELGYLGTFSE